MSMDGFIWETYILPRSAMTEVVSASIRYPMVERDATVGHSQGRRHPASGQLEHKSDRMTEVWHVSGR